MLRRFVPLVRTASRQMSTRAASTARPTISKGLAAAAVAGTTALAAAAYSECAPNSVIGHLQDLGER